jgi:predicted nucleic acid-binding protein
VETLGYHQLSSQQKTALESFFSSIQMLPLERSVLDEAVRLRQQRRMSLGDALIAGTALVHGLPLASNDLRDFKNIPGLNLLNPV